MKKFMFALWYVENGRKEVDGHEESHNTDALAMARAREILHEGKRDCQAMQIDLYEIGLGGWKHVVSYQ